MELKPCPFCGGKASSEIQAGHSTANDTWIVYCENCFIEAEKDTQEEAEAVWNRRIKGSSFRQININCDCGNYCTATVFKHIPFDLICNKCGRKFIESINENMDRITWSIKDGVVVEWKQ